MNNKLKNDQRGATLIGWLIIIVLIAFIGLIVVKVAPVYMESFTVRAILKELGNDTNVSAQDRAAVMSTIQKRLDINNISVIKRDNISLEQVNGGLEVTIDYENRFKLIGNLDGVAHFREQTVIRN